MSDHPLRALVVGTDDWAIGRAAATLTADGVDVCRCQDPGTPDFPCFALVEGRDCPLREGMSVDVVVAVRARPLEGPTIRELGVVCALRDGIPLVVAGASSSGPFDAWATRVVDRGERLVTACDAVRAGHRTQQTEVPPS